MGVNVQASVEVQLLGMNLMGMVAKTTKAQQTTTEFVIMPSALDENEPITVDKVVDEINRTIYKIENDAREIPEGTKITGPVSKQSITDAMDLVGLKDASLTFMQTFIHYKKVTEKNKAGEEAEAGKVIEYAIGVHIKGGEPQSNDFKFLQIKEVYINVWSTSNQKILERMHILTPEQLELLEEK